MKNAYKMNELDAKEYLQRTDYLFAIDKYAQLTEQEKSDYTQKREAAREVIRAVKQA